MKSHYSDNWHIIQVINLSKIGEFNKAKVIIVQLKCDITV